MTFQRLALLYRIRPSCLCLCIGMYVVCLAMILLGLACAKVAHTRLQCGNGAENEAFKKRADMVCVMDMGMHTLPKTPGLHLVVQLLVPGLEDRSRALPPLNSCQHTPGTEDKVSLQDLVLDDSLQYLLRLLLGYATRI